MKLADSSVCLQIPFWLALMRVSAAGSPANSPHDMIRNAPALCGSTPPTDSQSQLLIRAKWRSFLFEQSVKTGPPGIGEWVYFILRLVGWRGVSTMRAARVCVCVCLRMCVCDRAFGYSPAAGPSLVRFNIAAAAVWCFASGRHTNPRDQVKTLK